jgi:hypothetical protein
LVVSTCVTQHNITVETYALQAYLPPFPYNPKSRLTVLPSALSVILKILYPLNRYIPPGTKAKLLLPPDTANCPISSPEGFHLDKGVSQLISHSAPVGTIILGSHSHVNAVTSATGRVYIARSVSVDAIWEASGCVGEELSVLETLAVGRDVKAVDGSRVCEVVLVGESVLAGVCDVDVLKIGTEQC